MGAGFESDVIPGPIPEYEEISLKETKRVDIQLTDNAAYGVALKQLAAAGVSQNEPHTSNCGFLYVCIIIITVVAVVVVAAVVVVVLRTCMYTSFSGT